MKKYTISKDDRNTDIGRHLITMLGEVIYNKPRIIVELGVRKGRSTNIFAEACKMCGLHLISYDYKDCSGVCDLKNWEFYQMDSAEAGEKFKEKVDVLFIDTEHNKPQVMKELNAWIDKCNNDCLFIFHDTNPEWPRNVKIANEIGSVLDGINEFFGFKLNKNGCYDTIYLDEKYIYYITHKDYCEGMTYIRRTLK